MKNAFRGPHLYQGYFPIFYLTAPLLGISVIKYKVAFEGTRKGEIDCVGRQ